MIVSSSRFEPPSEMDVCVIGAGAAGITVARKLAADGHRVVLCEGGGADFSEESQAVYRGDVVGDEYFDLEVTRLRYLGGSTNHWGGLCRYFDELDFLDNRSAGVGGWPITKSNLDPYLNEASEILELPPFAADEALEDSSLMRVDFVKSPPVIFSEKFLAEFQSSKNLIVLLNANLLRLVPDSHGISEAVFTDYGGHQFGISAKKYVLAAGGIENSRILLWNDILSDGTLTNGSRNVGRYWMEHPSFTLGDVLLTNELPFSFVKRAFLSANREFQEEKGILHCGLRLKRGDYEGGKKLLADIACVAPEFGEWAADLFGRRLLCGAKLRAAWEQEPKSENRITLGPETDKFDIPRTRLSWTKSALDMRTPRETALELGRFLADKNYGRLRLDPWLIDEADFPSDDELAGNHHMGGTRMGTNPVDSVVDRDCKMFGRSNLYIAGSSVFPRAGHANPTLTIVQLALRLADHLHDTA